MRKLIAYGTVVLAFSLAPTLVRAKSDSASTEPVKPDQSFVTKAAQGGMAEVQLGKLAVERASNPAVKNFGQKMVDDHSKVGDELKQLADRKGITLPAAVDAQDKATYNRMSRLSGAAFDRAYMQDMMKDHRTDIADFQDEARSGADPDVRSFASKSLPTLQDHLKMAETASSEVSTTAKK